MLIKRYASSLIVSRELKVKLIYYLFPKKLISSFNALKFLNLKIVYL